MTEERMMQPQDALQILDNVRQSTQMAGKDHDVARVAISVLGQVIAANAALARENNAFKEAENKPTVPKVVKKKK